VPDEVLYYDEHDEHDTPQFVNILLPTESKDMQTPLKNRKTKKHEAFTEDSLSLQLQQ